MENLEENKSENPRHNAWGRSEHRNQQQFPRGRGRRNQEEGNKYYNAQKWGNDNGKYVSQGDKNNYPKEGRKQYRGSNTHNQGSSRHNNPWERNNGVTRNFGNNYNNFHNENNSDSHSRVETSQEVVTTNDNDTENSFTEESLTPNLSGLTPSLSGYTEQSESDASCVNETSYDNDDPEMKPAEKKQSRNEKTKSRGAFSNFNSQRRPKVEEKFNTTTDEASIFYTQGCVEKPVRESNIQHHDEIVEEYKLPKNPEAVKLHHSGRLQDTKYKKSQILVKKLESKPAEIVQIQSKPAEGDNFDYWDASPTQSPKFEKNKSPNAKHEAYKSKNKKKQDVYELDFNEYLSDFRFNKDANFKRVTEIQEDLFGMSKEYALAHCVAEDLNMGSGIAVGFRQQFKSIDYLLSQRESQGGVAILEFEGRFIYYLITKKISSGKPTLETLFRSLTKMKDHMVENHVLKLAIPRIGCGLDRLEWSEVKNMLEYVFGNTEVDIQVCNFQQAEEKMQKQNEDHKSRQCKLVTSPKNVTEIEAGTLIIYFGSEDGHISNYIKTLDKKWDIIREYQNSPKRLGQFFVHYKQNFGYALYCCIVKKSNKDLIEYLEVGKCVKEINKQNEKAKKANEKYDYVAIQDFEDETDHLAVSKVINILRNTFYQVEIYLCQGNLQ